MITRHLDSMATALSDQLKLAKLMRDFPRYAAGLWKVQPKVGQPRPFKLNNAQLVCQYSIDQQRKAGKPVRQKFLKYRQGGISTYTCGLMQHGTQTERGCIALSIADKLDLPRQWLRRAKEWLRQTPSMLKPIAKATNQIELYFEELASRYYIGSAEGTTPGMGDTIRRFHGSEVAKWAHPLDMLDDLLPAVPLAPETYVIFESTGEMVGDYWHKGWWASRRGEDDYVALFLPWFIHEEYVLDASDIIDLTPREMDIISAGERWAKESPEHAALIGFQGVSREQLAWRRSSMSGDPFFGDEDAFACKYPSTPEEAFLAGGRQIYNVSEVTKARETEREPLWRGEILPSANPEKFELVGSEGGSLAFYDHDPSKGQLPAGNWAIGADCQWGVKGDDPDYDAAWSESLESGRVGLHLHGRWPMGDYARILASLGHYYSGSSPAVLAPERNNEGGKQLIRPLMGLAGNDWRYPNLYVWSKDKPYGTWMPSDLGWQTDKNTKPALIAMSHQFFVDGAFDWACAAAVDELASIVKHDDLSVGAPEGAHDDRWMSRLITARVAHETRIQMLIDLPDPDLSSLSDHQRRTYEHAAQMDLNDARRAGMNEDEW